MIKETTFRILLSGFVAFLPEFIRIYMEKKQIEVTKMIEFYLNFISGMGIIAIAVNVNIEQNNPAFNQFELLTLLGIVMILFKQYREY